MEYVRGGELFARVGLGKLPEGQSRKLFHQLVSAVHHCHFRGVFHRDLKLENLLLDDNRDLKVSDFGLVALRRDDGLLHTQCRNPAYVAPEVLRKEGYDRAKADVWSCRVILFVLMAGFLPFQDENLMNMYKKIFSMEFRIPPLFSPDVRRLVTRLLIVDPDKRLSNSEIAEVPWFKKGGLLCAPAPGEQNLIEEEVNGASPRFYNAFELISAMSLGFDLSSLFEDGRRKGTVFTSKKGVGVILEGLEKVGLGLGFGVRRAKDGCKVRMEGKGREGRKEKLVVTAEVFELATELTVVEFCKDLGDMMDYVKFCDKVWPGLNDVVWTRQGDDLAKVVN